MKTLIIDRFENDFAICEDKREKKFFAITLAEMPKGVKSGDVLNILDNGKLIFNKEETAKRKAIIESKMQKLKSKE